MGHNRAGENRKRRQKRAKRDRDRLRSIKHLVKVTLRDLGSLAFSEAVGCEPFILPCKTLPADGIVEMVFGMRERRSTFVLSADH